MGQIGAARIDASPRRCSIGLACAPTVSGILLELDQVEAADADGLQQRVRSRATACGSAARSKRSEKPARAAARCSRTAREPSQVSSRAKPARRTDERQQEAGWRAAGVARDDDGRLHAVARADMALPGRQPVEALEDGAVGLRLEGAPERSRSRPDPRRSRAERRRAGATPMARASAATGVSDVEMRVKSGWNSLGHGPASRSGSRRDADYVREA